MRVRGAVARAEAGAAASAAGCHHCSTSPSRNCWRGVQQDLPSGEVRADREQRQHVLQLVAEAEGAAALVRPAAAPEPRGQQLVGQPVVDQPVERRLDGLDPQVTQRAGPEAPRLGKRSCATASEAWRSASASAAARSATWPSVTATDASPQAGTSTVPAKLQSGGRRRRRQDRPRPLDEIGPRKVALGPAQEALADMLLRVDRERGDDERPALVEVIARMGEIGGVAVRIGPDLQAAARVPGSLGERHLEIWHYAEPLAVRACDCGW